MLFTVDGKRWRKRFALIPTPVGVRSDGAVIYCWLQFYESHPADEYNVPAWRRRLPSMPDLTPYEFCDYG